MKAFSLILCVAFSVSAQQTSGPVVNTASVSIEADSDADNDGKVVVKTKNIVRAVVGNDGKISIGPEGGDGIINVNTLPATGAIDVVNMPIQDGVTAAGAKFSFRFNSVPQQFGSDQRHDNSLFIGYNADSAVTAEPMLGWRMENRFETSAGRVQSEAYFETSLPFVLYSRPIAVDLYHDNGQTQVSFNTPRLLVTESAHQQNAWLELLSTATTGNLNLYNDSTINYSGTRTYFVTHNGVGFLGRDLSNSRQYLFGFGSAQMEDARFFKGSTLLSGPLSISVGAEGAALRAGASLRWQATGNFSGFSDLQTAFDVDVASTANKIVQRDPNGAIDASSLKINGVETLSGGPCASILDPAPGERINNVTTIAILECLRGLKLLSQ